VLLPGTTFGIQFALALKSNLPSAGLVAVGMPTQVASCAKTGDVPAKAPIRLAAIAAARHAAPQLPSHFPQRPVVQPLPDHHHAIAGFPGWILKTL